MDPGLSHQADFGVPFVDFADQDLFDHVGRFSGELSCRDIFFLLDDIGGDILRNDVCGAERRDMHADILEEFRLVAAFDIDHNADLAFTMHVAADETGRFIAERSAENHFLTEFHELHESSQTGKLYLKLVNIGASSQTVTIETQGANVKGKAIVTTLKSAKPEDTNSIDNPNNITPSKSSLKVSNNFKITLAPYSISVVAI